MKGYVVYTDVGYENKFGEIVSSLSEAKVYRSEKEAKRNADTIWKYRKEYDIEEIGVAELYEKRYTKHPERLHRFDD